jgi:chemotaxis protein MotD
VVSVTQDIASTVSFQSARSTSSRDDQQSDSGSFGSLVDSNIVASANSDRAAAATQQDLPTPARRDDRSVSNDKARPSDDRTDQAASADARDRDAQAAGTANDGRKVKKGDKNDTKADSKSDAKTDSKSDTKDASSKGTDTTKATDADATAVTDKPVAVAAVAVAIPVPIATDVAVTATTPETAGAAQPLAIAAAVLKAQAAATEATATGAETVPATTAPEAEENFAALIASATPAAGKTGAKKTGVSDATTTATTAVKSDDKTATDATASTQPTDVKATAQTAAKDVKPDGTSADGAKPEAATPEPNKAAIAASQDHRTEHAAQPAAPDVNTPVSNALQQPLQTAPAAAAPQLTATVATNAPVPLNGVAVEIAQNAKSGKSSFDIRLDPAELGRIDVRLEVDKHGNVTSHLTVEKPETLTMLRQDAPQLQRALEQAGLKTSDSGLQFSLRDQSQGQQQNSSENSGRNAQRLVIHEDESVPAIAAGRGYGRMLGSSSGVDISI